MSERELRIAANESQFRSLNEGIEHAKAELGSAASFVCECGREDCEERIPLTLDEYEQVRSDARHFALKPGHEIEEVEKVIGRHDGFIVVEKDAGEASDLVERQDPRG